MTMNVFLRFFGHLHTVNAHRWQVFCNCVRAGIPRQGLCHDLSKYSPGEFFPGVKYYQGHRSPNTAQREAEGYSTAWMHHKGRNRHHFEYWTDFDPTQGQNVPVPMPRRFVAEMFCDRVAASKIYRKERYDDSFPLLYYQRGKDGRQCHEQTAGEIEMLLKMLSQEGEKKTFRYVRKVFLKH